MKILFFIECLDSGGKERRLVELVKGLTKFPEFEMELVVTKKEIAYKDIFTTNVKIHYCLRKDGLKKDPSLFLKFFKITKKFKPDIIHVWGNMVAIYAIPSKVLLKTIMINNQITNATIQKSNSLLGHKLVFPFSDRIVANTFAGLKAYNAPENRSSVIYNGFDFERIENMENKESVRNKFSITTEYVVGMVASFSEKKDYCTYIEAANEILEINKNVTFLCIGSGDSSKFQNMVSVKNKKKILFLGQQSHVESIMNICDVGVLITDRKHNEGISNAILEYHALCKPVIATYGGGSQEIIKQNTSGFLIEHESPIDLIDKINYFLRNKKERLDFGIKANEIVKEKFEITKMIEAFKMLYIDVTTKH